MAAPGGDPDADLVASAAAGDRDAFAALLDRRYDRVHRLAWRLTGTRADAQDVAQDVCRALAERIGGFRGETRFATWPGGVAVNACRDLARRRRSLRGLTERLAVVARRLKHAAAEKGADIVGLPRREARCRPEHGARIGFREGPAAGRSRRQGARLTRGGGPVDEPAGPAA